MRRFFLMLIVSWMFLGCSSVKQNIADNITYEIVNLEVDVASNLQNTLTNLFGGNIDKALEGDLKVHLAIQNLNSIDISAKKMKYNVFINNIYIGRGMVSNGMTIPANKRVQIKLPLHINSKVLLSNGISLTGNSRVDLTVKGTCTYSGIFGEEHIPFEIKNGKIKLN